MSITSIKLNFNLWNMLLSCLTYLSDGVLVVDVPPPAVEVLVVDVEPVEKVSYMLIQFH